MFIICANLIGNIEVCKYSGGLVWFWNDRDDMNIRLCTEFEGVAGFFQGVDKF